LLPLLLLLPQPCMAPATSASEATAPTINAESFLDMAAILRVSFKVQRGR